MKTMMLDEIPRPWFYRYTQEKEVYLETLYKEAKNVPCWDYFPDAAYNIALEHLELEMGMPMYPLFGKSDRTRIKRYIVQRLLRDYELQVQRDIAELNRRFNPETVQKHP